MLAAAITDPAAAQTSIHVVDADGRPIPAVQVDLHGRAELIGSASTSAQGVAELGPERWSEVRYIRLSHLAYETRIVQRDDLPADGVIRLVWEAIPIAGIDVDGTEPCPIVDDPEARRLWSDVAALYSTETGVRALSAYFTTYQDGRIRLGEMGQGSDARPTGYVFAGTPGVVHAEDDATVGGLRPLEERIENEGYAWPPFRINGVATLRAREWAYPELDRSQAYHFATAVFGKTHDFGEARESDGRITLTFCGRDRRGPTIDGTVTLVPGEALVAAEWRFRTLDPDERAGGSVSFASYVEASGAPPHLVASRGVFYRRGGPAAETGDLGRSYERLISANQRWHVHPAADHPCNTGYSLHGDPPTGLASVTFAECIAAHWDRQ